MNSLTLISCLIVIIGVYSRRLTITDDKEGLQSEEVFEDNNDFEFDIEVKKRSNGLPPKLAVSFREKVLQTIVSLNSLTVFQESLQKQVSIDMRSPLTDRDFKRGQLLTVDDFMPLENVSTFLNDPQLFEGDINEKVVSISKGKTTYRNLNTCFT